MKLKVIDSLNHDLWQIYQFVYLPKQCYITIRYIYNLFSKFLLFIMQVTFYVKGGLLTSSAEFSFKLFCVVLEKTTDRL